MANQVAVYKARFLEFKKISGLGYLKPMFVMCSGCLITCLRSESIICKASANLGIGSGMNGLSGALPTRRGAWRVQDHHPKLARVPERAV